MVPGAVHCSVYAGAMVPHHELARTDHHGNSPASADHSIRRGRLANSSRRTSATRTRGGSAAAPPRCRRGRHATNGNQSEQETGMGATKIMEFGTPRSRASITARSISG